MDRWIIIPTFFLVLIMAGTAVGATIVVPTNYATIQEAIDAAVAGDEVVVVAGNYTENIDFAGKAITIRSESGAAATVIDGGQIASCVLFANGEGPDSVLEGFTLTNGIGTFAPAPFNDTCGGAIFCDGTSPTLRDNIMEDNTARYGGAVCFSDSDDALLEANTIRNNSAKIGGALLMRYSTPEVSRNRISNNTASFGGGGIALWLFSHALLVNNIIDNNSAGSGGGGGIRSYHESEPDIINCTVCDNTSTAGGGGLYCHNAYAIVTNSIFWNNDAPIGPEIRLGYTVTPSSLTISWTDVKGGFRSFHAQKGSRHFWLNGIMDEDPLFVGSGDYHLSAASPCIDAGRGAANSLPSVDIDGDHRFGSGRLVWSRIDMGADEFVTVIDGSNGFSTRGKLLGRNLNRPGTPRQ